ncbi:MAG: hypothetical protein GF330_01475 [Candidatus Eisenbacteria bacterium]|nr:hypothetical protein [Candidatus Eisenbacteria bacterium]
MATLVDRHLPAGQHVASWEASGVAAGIYFCRLELGGSRVSRRVLQLR